MAIPDYQDIVARIDTGAEDAASSRALIVFNPTDEALSGVAFCEVSATWPLNDLVPFVAVTDLDGTSVTVDMPDLAEGPDPEGRTDHRLLALRIRFAVRDIPAQGWKTYLLFLADSKIPDEVDSAEPEGLDVEAPGLLVLETTRHSGELPPTGTF